MFADAYIPIKAHGFEQITFVTPYFVDDEFRHRLTLGQEETVKELTNLLKEGKELPVTITITVSDRTASFSDTVSAQ
jgi:hypothetical protein